MKRLALAIVILFGFASPTWADFQAGVAAYVLGDYAKALHEWRPLAEQGLAAAQYTLGEMYHNGDGVPQDSSEAVKWYRRAAEQGLAEAQYNLGVMYAEGLGIPQDYAAAVKWYRKAAEQGAASAQGNLGVMYYNGHGVPQNYVEAHMWHKLAAAGLPPGEDRDSAAENRDSVAKLMTPAQIAEAQRLEGKWRPRRQSGAAPDN